jgi:hypothetical protein
MPRMVRAAVPDHACCAASGAPDFDDDTWQDSEHSGASNAGLGDAPRAKSAVPPGIELRGIEVKDWMKYCNFRHAHEAQH